MLRKRRPPKFSKEEAWRRLLAVLDRTEPKTGAAKMLLGALEREGMS